MLSEQEIAQRESLHVGLVRGSAGRGLGCDDKDLVSQVSIEPAASAQRLRLRLLLLDGGGRAGLVLEAVEQVPPAECGADADGRERPERIA